MTRGKHPCSDHAEDKEYSRRTWGGFSGLSVGPALRPCRNPGVYEIAGKWYCWRHAPRIRRIIENQAKRAENGKE